MSSAFLLKLKWYQALITSIVCKKYTSSTCKDKIIILLWLLYCAWNIGVVNKARSCNKSQALKCIHILMSNIVFVKMILDIKMILKKYKNANHNIELKIMLINIKLKQHWAQNNIEFKILLKITQDNNRIILRWVHAWGMWGKVGRKGGHYRTYCDLLLICRGLHKISVCCVLQYFPVFRITGHTLFFIFTFILGPI